MGKVRMTRSRSKQGTDCYTFEIAFHGELKNLPKQPLINDQGRKYGYVEVKEGKASVKLVLPNFVRCSNIQPFTLLDSIYLEIIKNDCENQLKRLLGPDISSKIESIECNITQPVSGKATQSDVLNLLCHAFLTRIRDVQKYVGPNKSCPLKEETHTQIYKKQHYYTMKGYDKTEQQRVKTGSKVVDANEPELLRLEIIMVDRTIKKLFPFARSFSDILTEKSLIKIFREYKRIFYEDISVKVRNYLNSCVRHLVESLCHTESPIETIAKEREAIPDARVLQRALEKWMKTRKRAPNNALRDARRYAAKYALPQDVILTLRDFKNSCG